MIRAFLFTLLDFLKQNVVGDDCLKVYSYTIKLLCIDSSTMLDYQLLRFLAETKLADGSLLLDFI